MYRRDVDRIAGSPACMLALIALAALAGCGGQQSSQPAMQSLSQQSIVLPQQVTVSPATVQIAAGSSYQFAVTVTPANAANTVNWSVAGTGCSGAACGTVDIMGRYTAPSSAPSPAAVTVTATSAADQTRVGKAQVTITSAQSSAGNFLLVGNMTAPRVNSTAILLPDGRVLIAGGEQSGPTAELYNPATATFQPSSANLTGIPVLLHDGQVLVVASATAELYDPNTDSTAPTGHLLVNQDVFAATVLASGKVLVLGSHDAELYDPASGTFMPAGQYAVALSDVIAKAVLLADGRVLVFGNYQPQLYDPATNSFSLTGSLAGTGLDYMDLFSATLLKDGRVLVAGGMSDWRTDAAVIYDPATGKFTETGSMNDARDAHTAVLLSDGRVLVLGGDGWSCSGSGAGSYCYFTGSLSSAELYDPATGTFSRAGNMNQARDEATATLLQNGDVLITGGVTYCGIGCFLGSNASAELYHPN